MYGREKRENKNGSLLLLSPPSRRHLLPISDGAAQALPLLDDGTQPAEIGVVFAYHSPDEVLSFGQLGQFYLNIDATGTPIFPSVRTVVTNHATAYSQDLDGP